MHIARHIATYTRQKSRWEHIDQPKEIWTKQDRDKDPRIRTTLHWGSVISGGQMKRSKMPLQVIGWPGTCSRSIKHTAENLSHQGRVVCNLVSKVLFMREVSVFRLCGSVGSPEGLSACDSPERSRALWCVFWVILEKGKMSHYLLLIL